MRRPTILALAALVVSLACSGARAQTIGSVVIDDSTDNLTVSLDGTDLTSLLLTGLPPGTTVGTLDILGGLILTGAGCNNPGGAGECANLTWLDPNVITSLESGANYASPLIRLFEAPTIASDFVSLTITGRGESGTEFSVDLHSDGDPGFPATDCTIITGCVDLLETGDFQNVTTLLLTPVATCLICTLPTGITNFSASVRSDVEPTIPEPATLALLGLGFAGFAFSRRKSL